MSQDRFDLNIEPNWDDMDLSWLDTFDSPAQPKQSAPAAPAQSHFEPEAETGQINHPRQIPTDPEQYPASVQYEMPNLWDDVNSLWEDPAPAQKAPAPAQKAPAPAQKAPAPARRQPVPTARESVPAQWAGEPDRRNIPQNRQAAPQGRGNIPQNRRPAQQGGRNVPPGGRTPRTPLPDEPSPWDLERQNTGYKQKSRRRSKAPLVILIVLLVVGMGFAGWQLGSIFLNYHRDRSAYNDLAAHAISMLADFETGEDANDETGENKTHSVSEIPIAVDWNYLKSINANVVGWIYGPGTVVSYPVVQTSDHDYYLNHGFDGSSNVSGTLFADRNSVAGITQSNYIIYGHNMKDNSMFGTFSNYVDKSYFDSNPILYYLTPDANYRIELLCAHTVESTVDNYPTYFSSNSEYQAFLNKITSGAYWVNSNVLSTNYQLVSMSTCTYTSGYNDPRFVVHGMMIPLD